MGQLNVLIHVAFESIQRVRVELSNITTDFEKKRVTILECAVYQLLVLIILRHNLCIARVRRQIHSQSD